MSKRKREEEGVKADVVRSLQKNDFEKLEAILRREFEKLTSDWDQMVEANKPRRLYISLFICPDILTL